MILEDLKEWLDDKRKEKLEDYEWALKNKFWSFSHAANNMCSAFEQTLEKLRELEDEYREA